MLIIHILILPYYPITLFPYFLIDLSPKLNKSDKQHEKAITQYFIIQLSDSNQRL